MACQRKPRKLGASSSSASSGCGSSSGGAGGSARGSSSMAVLHMSVEVILEGWLGREVKVLPRFGEQMSETNQERIHITFV